MTESDEIAKLVRENDSLQKTVAALTKHVESMLGSSSSMHDTFSQSVILQQIVSRRTLELEQITESIRTESEHRRIAEETMRNDRRLLQSVLSHIPYLVSWKGNALEFLGCNTAFAQSIGLDSEEQILGVPEQDLAWKFSEQESYLERERVVMETGESVIDHEEVRVLSNGQEVTFLTNVIPMRNDEGDISGVLSISKDITKRKQLEIQLMQSQKLESIGQLAAGIAHEINTPIQYVGDNTRFVRDEFSALLKIIDNYCALLDENNNPRSWNERAAETRQMVESVDFEFLREEIPIALSQSIDGIERISHIVQAMKEFSHPGSSSKEPVDLNKAIESTVTVCSNRWKYVANLELNLDSELPTVPCLLGELNQVILNLIVNAADAIESTRENHQVMGSITISTRLGDNCAEIEISDTGGGIPDNIRDRIFDPFFTTKEVGKGTGQGLAISHDVIVEKHGGTIQCRVEANKGTIFLISLPLHENVTHLDAA